MTGVVVFCGPTVDAATVRGILPDADCRPPAAQGDLHVAALDRPAAIGLIDGVFLDRPSVWHKEILAALDAGVPVWGAASMGALRAVECAPYGMRGVGRIFEAYRSGRYAPFRDRFEDDDEVAVTHGPPQLGSPQLSHAMVDLRETLARAESAGAIGAPRRDAIAARLKALPFAERSLDALCAMAEADAPGLGERLRPHRASQKREDALALLAAMVADRSPQPAAPFRFERTLDWERFTFGAGVVAPSEAERQALAALEARPALRRAIRRRAAARLAALDGTTPSTDSDIAPALEAFRRDRELPGTDALDEWAARNLLPAADLPGLVADEAALDALADREPPGRLAHAMLDELRLDGRLAGLLGVAEAKG